MKHIKADHKKRVLTSLLCLVMAAVLLSGCGKEEPASAPETQKTRETKAAKPSAEPAASGTAAPAETLPVSAQTVPAATQPETVPSETETADEESPLYLPDFSGSAYFEIDYGFSEDRAWVRDKMWNRLLINTEGEILYEVPKTVRIDGVDAAVNFDHFDPLRNGTAYITGRADYRYDVSVIIDKDGRELACFIGTDDLICRIVGRSDDRFLLMCLDRSGLETKVYVIPLGNDGKPADVPRLVSENGSDYDTPSAVDFGEGFFGSAYFAYYNLNNNTVQQTDRWEAKDQSCRFYNGITLANGYLVTTDQLQEDRINLVVTNNIGYIWNHSNEHLSQYGRVWSRYNFFERETGLYDQSGQKIEIPGEIGASEGSVDMSVFDDGYILFQEYSVNGKLLLSMMAPDNSFLYIHKTFEGDFHPGSDGAGGYITGSLYTQDKTLYGVVDREGKFHTFDEDLSELPGLDELRFGGFGSGYLLEMEQHLGISLYGDERAFIRSLDGKQEVASVRRTSRTHTMADTLSRGNNIDLSQAKPVGASGSSEAAALTTDDEVRAMGEYGVIVVDKLLGVYRDQLVFEQDGVTVTLRSYDYEHYFEVKNNNPDNKKVDVIFSDKIFYDGLYLEKMRGTQKGTGWLKSGESATVYYSIVDSDAQFRTEISNYATGLAELPLTELSLHFSVQIGSKSEQVNYTRVLRSSRWTEDDWGDLYGDLVGDFEYGGELIYSVYRIRDERGNTFAIRNRTDTELFAKYWPWFAQCQWYVEGEKYGGIFSLLIPPEGSGIVHFTDIDSVYKELELPNGTPIHLSLSIPIPGDKGMMELDLGEIRD